jgi:homoserine O-acetyltransferase
MNDQGARRADEGPERGPDIGISPSTIEATNAIASASLGGVDGRDLPGERMQLPLAVPLDCGVAFEPITVAYQTYGRLNDQRSNAILICHALTGDQFAAEPHPLTGKAGWWDLMIGPGKPIDTDRYFIICTNILGGCMGTTGPMELEDATGKPFGLNFPVITIGDMVRVQAALLDQLGIERLFAVAGGSMGGMQVLEWAARYPDRVFSALPIATSARHSAQNIAFHEVGRQAIMADPDWHGGGYYDTGQRPVRGLSVARMAAHITYLSEPALHRKFGRALQDRNELTYGFDADFQVESYLRHQGITFVDRFDANSYLYVTRAMDYFDLGAGFDGVLANAFRGTDTRFCVLSFSSDWLFPTAESRDLVRALTSVAANVSSCEFETDRGHDSFLLDEPEFHRVVSGFLDGAASAAGLS